MKGPIKSRWQLVKLLYNQYWDEQYAAREAGYWMWLSGKDEASIAKNQNVPERERWQGD